MSNDPELASLTDLELLRLPYLAVHEANRRGLVSTYDLPSGGYAEYLAGRVYGGQRLGAAGRGHDLVTTFGDIEVKAVVRGNNTSPAHPNHFTFLVLVRFDDLTMDVVYAVEADAADIVRIGRPHQRGGITLGAPSRRLSHAACRDVTDLFRAAAALHCPDCETDFFDPPVLREGVWVGVPMLVQLREHQRLDHRGLARRPESLLPRSLRTPQQPPAGPRPVPTGSR